MRETRETPLSYKVIGRYCRKAAITNDPVRCSDILQRKQSVSGSEKRIDRAQKDTDIQSVDIAVRQVITE